MRCSVFCNAMASSSVAMNAIIANTNALNTVVASSVAMNAVAASSVAMNAVVKSTIASTAVDPIINNYASVIANTVNDTSKFSASSFQLGDGKGSWESNIGSNVIIIPTTCYDDGDTNFTASSGINRNRLVIYIEKHVDEQQLPPTVALRGVYLNGEGGSGGYMRFNMYTAI